MIKITCPTIGQKEIQAVKEVLLSKNLGRGEKTKKFEREATQKFGSKNAIALANGTAGLFVSLLACDISEDDEVITSPFTFVATTNSIIMCRAKPVFVDIDPKTFNLNPNLIEQKVTKKTKAILTVDLYGQSANYKAIKKIAQKYKLLLISDSCQAAGALYEGKPILNWTDISVFSFFISKNITSGEGGLVLTNNSSIAEKVNLFINHGQKRGHKYEITSFGYNFRLTDIQSAILLVQLKRLNEINRKRVDNAAYLYKNLEGIKGIALPSILPLAHHVFSRFTLRITKDFPFERDVFKEKLLRDFDIETEIAYPKPLHYYQHIAKFGYKHGDFPNAEKAAKEVLSLPVHQNLSKDDLQYIVRAIKQISKIKKEDTI